MFAVHSNARHLPTASMVKKLTTESNEMSSAHNCSWWLTTPFQLDHRSMFSRVFDGIWHSSIKSSAIEHTCMRLVHDQLEADGLNNESFDSTGTYQHLQELLTSYFRAGTPFWAKFYQRKEKEHRLRASLFSQPLTETELAELARGLYPAIYIPVDMYHFRTGTSRLEYQLIVQSLQSLLTAC